MKIARLKTDGTLKIKGELIEKDKEIIIPYLEFGEGGSATVPHNSIFNTTDAITISVRIRIVNDGSSTYGEFMTKPNAFAWALGVRRRDGYTIWYSSMNNGMWVIGAFPELIDGEWHNVVFSYDKDAGENNQRFYIDGVLKEQRTALGALTISSIPINLVTSSFLGGIRDARIYNRQLTDSEVMDLFEEKSVTDGLLGHWAMDEGVGNVLNDSSPYGNHGTVTGGVWGEEVKKTNKIPQLMPNGDLIIYGKLVKKAVPLPPEDEIWIYGTFTTTYEIGQLLGDWGANSRVVDFYYDNDHYVIKASGNYLGETFCRVFNTNGNTVIFGSQFSLTAAFHQASNATFIILNNAIAIRTQNHYMQAKKIYVPDNLVETYKAQTSAIAIIGEVLPLSDYTTVMPRITPDGTLLVGKLIEGWDDIPTDNLALHLDASTLDLAVGTEILQWDDISGNANHATQNTKTKQPIFTSINNSPSVYFDGIDDTMVSNITSTNDFTLIGVVNVIDGGGVFQWANREKSSNPYVYRYRNSVNSQQWYINRGYRIVDNINDGETHVFTLTRNDATEHCKSYVNGSETGNYVGGNIDKNANDVFWIGQGYHGFTKAYWHELLIYDRPLTDTERQKVEEYLMAKWLIQT